MKTKSLMCTKLSNFYLLRCIIAFFLTAISMRKKHWNHHPQKHLSSLRKFVNTKTGGKSEYRVIPTNWMLYDDKQFWFPSAAVRDDKTYIENLVMSNVVAEENWQLWSFVGAYFESGSNALFLTYSTHFPVRFTDKHRAAKAYCKQLQNCTEFTTHFVDDSSSVSSATSNKSSSLSDITAAMALSPSTSSNAVNKLPTPPSVLNRRKNLVRSPLSARRNKKKTQPSAAISQSNNAHPSPLPNFAEISQPNTHPSPPKELLKVYPHEKAESLQLLKGIASDVKIIKSILTGTIYDDRYIFEYIVNIPMC